MPQQHPACVQEYIVDIHAAVGGADTQADHQLADLDAQACQHRQPGHGARARIRKKAQAQPKRHGQQDIAAQFAQDGAARQVEQTAKAQGDEINPRQNGACRRAAFWRTRQGDGEEREADESQQVQPKYYARQAVPPAAAIAPEEHRQDHQGKDADG